MAFLAAKRSYMGIVALSFVLLLVWSSVTWDQHHFFERPVQYSLITLFVAGAALLGLTKTDLPFVIGRSPVDESLKKGKGYRAVRGTDRSNDVELLVSHRRTASSKDDDGATPEDGTRKDKLVLAVVALCVALRVGLSKKMLETPQCTVESLEKLALPIIFAVYDYTQGLAYKKTANDERDSISNTAFEDFWDFFRWTNIRYLPLSLALSWSIYLTSPAAHASTAMCAGISGQHAIAMLLQLAALCLDVAIIILGSRVVVNAGDDKNTVEVMGRASFASVIILCIGGIIGLLLNLSSLGDILTTTKSLKISALFDGLALALLLFCLGYLLKDLRPLALVFIGYFISVFFPMLLWILEDRKPFPPHNHGRKVFGLVMACVTFLTFLITYRASELKDAPSNILKRIHKLSYLLLMGGMIFGIAAAIIRPRYVGFHPIKLMMYRANDEATRWSKDAFVSKSLDIAVKEYASRYHRLPPPNFDVWYNFAKAHNSQVIDDFDQINNDLLPFWGTEPSVIRANSVPKTNTIGSIKINMNGPGIEVVAMDKESMPMAEMILSFAQWLPPMQILIHRHSEPQVSIPSSKRKSLENKAVANLMKSRSAAIGNWTASSAEDWPKLPAGKDLKAPKVSSMHLSKWDAYVQPSCPYFSPARQHPHFSDKLCIDCASLHSINQFMWNTTKALDLCDQPDLGTISNFLASPATAPLSGYSSNELVPIFSPRKAEGYNDILYPAPGSYIQRNASTAPPGLDFSISTDVLKTQHGDLSNSLFWLGQRPTTSGLRPNSWQRLAEQRLVQLADWENKASGEKVPFLLPMDDKEKFYMNAFVKLSGVGPQLPIKANFTVSAPAEDCQKPKECKVQDGFFGVEHFGETKKTHEESRFNHRFSLTMDTDPMHKFVQDLASNSAAVQSTIFRSWYTPRLTAWLHYVPLDMRWHGLHGTLAYFMGMEGIVKGREVKMKRRGSDALAIAREGRKRVESVMGEKDAEVYMFRLLLEWGRIVNDDRESLGYVQPE